MSRKNLDQRFSQELDAYIRSGQVPSKVDHDEYHELFELGKNLADQDFSTCSNKAKILQRVMTNTNGNRGDEDNRMKKSSKMMRPVIAAATLAMVGVLSIGVMKPAFAQDLFDRIVHSVSFGHITVEQHEYPTGPISVPSELAGKIFDQAGNPIYELNKEITEKLYTASGEEIVGFDDGEIVTKAERAKLDKENKANILTVNNPNQLNDYTCFNVILPTYLPAGFSFDRAEFYKGEDGTVSNSKYIDLFFTNEKSGKSFIMHNRFADEETAFIRSTDGTVESIKINDLDAVLVNERDIDWEYKGVLYGIAGKKSGLDRDELIRIAASIQ